MRALLCLSLVLLTACQSGRIPCPEPKAVKVKRSVIHKRFLNSDQTLSAKADDDPKARSARDGNKSSVRVISSVSVEEWDCPQPGRKKYMPRSVRQNIRKNMKKINTPENKRDSVATQVHP
ncbi:hypothetical protein KK062_12465 [Fulvivirgaceae bacterium PWU5]|uniref:Uncharacterized protein n=1 Tax=Dawidia cretensis TaxID=2782350 RepID=A0AAP2GPW6_9BACT|nr:hypothetical protein [Dawidia cretensis]MBT1709046.1 hypothetical protein [Dawidia cretensis]